MNIQLISFKVDKISLDFGKQEKEVVFSQGPRFPTENLKSFAIIFDLSIAIKDKLLNIIFVSEFETDEDITDKFRNNHFCSINAPAIAYPYLRAYVSNFLLSSGYKPLILPTINFQKLSKLNADDKEVSK